MSAMKDLMMVSYVYTGRPEHRFRQRATDAIPEWAVDVRDEIPTAAELPFLSSLAHEDAARETLGLDLTGAVWPDDAETMNIPEIGDRLTLVEPWSFKLYREYRNATMLEVMGISYLSEIEYTEQTLLRGTKLSIDRVFIRRGAKEYSSVTFNLIGHKLGRVRFWAKLADVNRMVFRRT